METQIRQIPRCPGMTRSSWETPGQWAGWPERQKLVCKERSSTENSRKFYLLGSGPLEELEKHSLKHPEEQIPCVKTPVFFIRELIIFPLPPIHTVTVPSSLLPALHPNRRLRYWFSG